VLDSWPQSPNPAHARREFTTTRWSLVLRAGGTDPDQVQAALEQLCRDYWYPLYAYVRRKGHTPEDASDLTQDFFAKLLANDFAQGLTPDGGRFRSFLLTAMGRFLINEWQKGNRMKRGGGTFTDSLDALIEERGEASYLAESSHTETPEMLYQRVWAETMLSRAVDRLGRECAERGMARFDLLRRFLSLGEEPPALAEAATEFGMSLPAFKSLLHRFRQRYRELLLEEVGQTVGSFGDVADELRGLLAALRGK
jgi:DNA-directed RNA polymerase specialized sigma24 family protein